MNTNIATLSETRSRFVASKRAKLDAGEAIVLHYAADSTVVQAFVASGYRVIHEGVEHTLLPYVQVAK